MHWNVSDGFYGDDLGNEDEVGFVIGTLYGTEHPWFWRVHITALISLGRSRKWNSNWNSRIATTLFESDLTHCTISQLIYYLFANFTLMSQTKYIQKMLADVGRLRKLLRLPKHSWILQLLSATIELFTIRSHLHFKPKFTSRGLKNFKKLPPVGIEITTLTITTGRIQFEVLTSCMAMKSWLLIWLIEFSRASTILE